MLFFDALLAWIERAGAEANTCQLRGSGTLSLPNTSAAVGKEAPPLFSPAMCTALCRWSEVLPHHPKALPHLATATPDPLDFAPSLPSPIVLVRVRRCKLSRYSVISRRRCVSDIRPPSAWYHQDVGWRIHQRASIFVSGIAPARATARYASARPFSPPRCGIANAESAGS